MNLFQISFFAFFAISSAAQLPSRAYLPSTGFQQGSFSQSQTFQTSQSSAIIGSGGLGDTGNRRPQQEVEKNAQILKQEQEANENGFHYSYETSNGIRAEEAGNTAQSQGGFSYKGDDGNTYTVTFTAGEGGYRPQGAHLPVPPPTPEAILIALQQNAKDEAAGIFDDGKYRPEIHGGGLSRPTQAGSTSITSGSSSSQTTFGSTSHQQSFHPSTGYQY